MGLFHGTIEGYQNNTVWPIRRRIFEINVTNVCNLACPNCQACVGVAPDYSNIDVEAIANFVDDSIAAKYMWEVIKLTGGEALLHPQIGEIVKIIGKYEEYNKTAIAESGLCIAPCQVRILTNGSSVVQRLLKTMPKWVVIQNQSSVETAVWNRFESFNIAPIDLEEYRDIDANVFRQGCMRVCKCGGAALGTDGLYYPCVVAYQVARVFRLSLGWPNLHSFIKATDGDLRDCLQHTCRYCGFFKYPRHLVCSQAMSPTWSQAITRYNSKMYL